MGVVQKPASPMQTSKDTLDKCASAGETFGRVMGLRLVFCCGRFSS
jgi:hypothetical protein